MKKICYVVFMVLVLGQVLLFAGCSSGTDGAKTALEAYLTDVKNGEYDGAYELLCEFDKGNISKELFTEWRTLVAKMAEIGESEVNSKIDKFKDFEYLGTVYKRAFGFEVECKYTDKIKDVKLQGYDKSPYKIMVVKEGEEYKVALLLTNLDDLVQKYKDQIK